MSTEMTSPCPPGGMMSDEPERGDRLSSDCQLAPPSSERHSRAAGGGSALACTRPPMVAMISPGMSGLTAYCADCPSSGGVMSVQPEGGAVFAPGKVCPQPASSNPSAPTTTASLPQRLPRLVSAIIRLAFFSVTPTYYNDGGWRILPGAYGAHVRRALISRGKL